MALYREIWKSFLDNTIIGYLHTVNNSTIPINPGNIDYQKVQEWMAAGNTPEPAYTQAEINAFQAETDRAQEIYEAQESTGLRHITVQQAYNYIDNTLNAATTATETKEAIRTIFKKIAVFLLK